MGNESLDQITLPAGSTIHFKGLPFSLPFDIIVEGRKSNLELASKPDVETGLQSGRGGELLPRFRVELLAPFIGWEAATQIGRDPEIDDNAIRELLRRLVARCDKVG